MKPNDMQEAFLDYVATQCGYCTPGIYCRRSASSGKPQPPPQEIREAISGNLCRCTGYQQIIDAIESTAKTRNEKKNLDIGGKNG